MNICLCDKNLVAKSVLHPNDARIFVKSNGDLYAEIKCSADEYFKGGILLDDIVELPYPSFKTTNFFRIRRIDTENGWMTIVAYHITHDFENAYCRRDATTSCTLEGLSSFFTYDSSSNLIRNSRTIRFSVFRHSTTDARYDKKHDFTIPKKMSSKIIEHLQVIFGCNIVRFGREIILTYGTASDYFRSLFEMPPFSAVLTEGRNISGVSTSADNTEKITMILPYAIVDKVGTDTEITGTTVKPTGSTETTDELGRHLVRKEYSTEFTYDTASQDWDTFVANVKADITAQAQAEVDAKCDDEQSISVESISLQNETIFGGETCIVADKHIRKDFSAQISSFEMDMIFKRYENIELGRTTLNLADLGKMKRGAK